MGFLRLIYTDTDGQHSVALETKMAVARFVIGALAVCCASNAASAQSTVSTSPEGPAVQAPSSGQLARDTYASWIAGTRRDRWPGRWAMGTRLNSLSASSTTISLWGPRRGGSQSVTTP